MSRLVQKTLGEADAPGAEIAALLPPFRQTLTMTLFSAREAVMSRMRPILRAHGVTEQQWRVLRTLNGAGEVEVTALSRRALLHPPSLTRILRDLVARGLVRRRCDQTDMRRGLVSITPQGLALIREAAPEVARVNQEIDRLYGPEQGRRLRELLASLEQVLGGGVIVVDGEE